jgi:hypothetical protein
MPITRGVYNKFQITIENEETGLPIDSELVNDLNLHLFTEASKDVALYGNGNIAIENPSAGVFIIEIDPEISRKLNVGETAYLEGITLPYKLDVSIDLGIVSNNRAADDTN